MSSVGSGRNSLKIEINPDAIDVTDITDIAERAVLSVDSEVLSE